MTGEGDALEHKRIGAAFVTFAVAWLAMHGGMEWWEIGLIVAMTYYGLHSLAGVKLKWWG